MVIQIRYFTAICESYSLLVLHIAYWFPTDSMLVILASKAASIASKLARGMFSDLGSNQSCSGLSD
ncbi:hypothetical protein Goshw_029519 [Gossypium schwendimanii]|uniref:Uncharacterized protein n=1 Tax=Gossypium schwendimanii TaxID=34291 RepID=A0A7J9KVH3_GOSSC|nr:hypothetical protein [Gossypium schwendimanii]